MTTTTPIPECYIVAHPPAATVASLGRVTSDFWYQLWDLNIKLGVYLIDFKTCLRYRKSSEWVMNLHPDAEWPDRDSVVFSQSEDVLRLITFDEKQIDMKNGILFLQIMKPCDLLNPPNLT